MDPAKATSQSHRAVTNMLAALQQLSHEPGQEGAEARAILSAMNQQLFAAQTNSRARASEASVGGSSSARDGALPGRFLPETRPGDDDSITGDLFGGGE